MAGNIKGITIEFQGDTTRLDKALRSINKNTKALDDELKQVNNALKFNPKNVELWRQKQQLLTQKVDETKNKLDVLKQAQAKMDASGVDKNTAEYRELQRQIIVTENQVKNFESQLRKIGNVNLKVLSEKFKDVGTKLQDVGKGFSKYVTGPLVGLGAVSIKSFNEVKDGLNIVAQKTGATGEELTGMQDIARDLAKTLPTSFEDAGTAVGELNTRFGVTGDELETLSEQYIKFAKVNGVELNQSIDETQKALAAFGLGAEKAPQLLDTLTRAGQLTGASVDSLTQGLVQNAAAFQELGLNMDQSVMLMAQMETSGANSETVMQGLRKALKNAAAEGKPFDQALKELQDTILNGSGSMDGLTAAYDLFGKSGDQIYNAVKNGTLDFEALGAAVDDTGGTLDSVFKETLTPAEKFQTTMNSLKDAGYEIGNSLMTVLEPAIKKVSEKIQQLSEWWSSLSPETQNLIVKIALIAAAIGPLLIVIGKISTAIGSIISLIGVIGPAIGGLALGPLAIIVGAIAAVIAIGVLLYKNWDKIKATAQAVGQKIKEIWTNVKTSVLNAVNSLKTGLSNAWTAIKNAVTKAAKTWFDAMTWPYRKAWDFIKGIIDKIKNLFPIDIKNFFSKIKLPHFSWDWIDLGGFISIPKINIDWYKEGGIFSSPTIAGIGEAGAEAVVPLNKFWDKLDNIAAASGAPTINIYPGPNQSAREIAKEVEKILIQQQKQRSNAYGI